MRETCLLVAINTVDNCQSIFQIPRHLSTSKLFPYPCLLKRDTGVPLIDSMASLVLQQLLFPVGHPLLDARRVRHLLPLPERVRRRRRRVLGDAPLLQAVPVAVLKWGTVITHHTQ